MCGIIGAVSCRPIAEDIKQGLVRISYRGYDSFGAAISNHNEITVIKDVGAVQKMNVDGVRGMMALGHVRWASHGKVTKENAHPFVDCTESIAVVHNGIIDNYEQLKSELIKNGHIFTSDTDSEVIVHLIEEYSKTNSFEKAFKLAVQRLIGSYAIAAIHKNYSFIMVARKDSPLLIGKSQDTYYIASDLLAFNASVKKISEVKDGEIVRIGLDSEIELKDAGDSINESGKDGYDHFMLKEINEQPSKFLEALKQDKNQLVNVAFDILRAKNVILAACGTSRFASLVGRYLMLRLGKRMSETIVGSELQYFKDSFGENTLIIAVSQSGETADVITGVKIAKERGTRILSIINKPYSLLERMSDTTLFVNCGSEVAVASTKAFTNELVIFYLLSFVMANKYDEGMVELFEIPKKIEECLAQSGNIKEVAHRIKDVGHIYYVGKGINFAVSGECALKLKEVSYIHAESMSAGELKHGTLSLIEDGTPIIGVCPDDYTHQEVISNLHEAKARGGLVIGISDKVNTVYDYWLPIPQVSDIYYPLVSVVVGQLLAYYVAVERGLNPDFPRNLAKSLTVR